MEILKEKEQFNNNMHNVLIKQKKSFVYEETNSTKMLIYDKKNNFGYRWKNKVGEADMKKLWIYAAVRKSFSNYAKKNNGFKIYKSVPSIVCNFKNIDKLKMQDRFMATDAKHCYWRVAYLLGYINEKLYKKLAVAEYKLERNKAMACVKSLKKIQIYKRGVLKETIHHGDAKLTAIYENIRNRSHYIISQAAKAAGKDLIKYKTDCVYYDVNKKEKVEAVFEKYNLLFETNECTYLSNRNFMDNKTTSKL